MNIRSPNDCQGCATYPDGAESLLDVARFTLTNVCPVTLHDMDINPEHVVKHPFFAGVVGSAISLRWIPGTTIGGKLVIVAIGAATAQFLGPAVAEYFALSSQGMMSAISFLIGLFGLNMMASVSLWIKSVDIGALIGRK